MKRYKILGTLVLFGALLFSGCQSGSTTLDPAGAYKGDKANYDAEHTISLTYQTLDDLLKIVDQDKAILPQSVLEVAHDVAQRAPLALQTAVAFSDAAKSDPSQPNKDKLAAQLAVVQSLLTEIQNDITLLNDTAKAATPLKPSTK